MTWVRAGNLHRAAMFFRLGHRRAHTLCDRSRIAAIKKDLSQMGGGSVSLQLGIPGDPKIAMITITNTGRKNSLSGRMMSELHDCVEELANWESGAALIVTGCREEGFFCAGADLKVAQSHLLDPAAKGGENMSYFMHYVTRRLRTLPLVSVAAIEGGCVGGGAELSTACDFRVMAENSYIHFVHAKMSVTPGWGGGTRLTRIVGRQAALSLLCGCRRLQASEAHTMGLCDQVSLGGQAASEAATLLARITQHSSQVSRAMKTLVSRADEDTLLPALTHEHEVFSSLWGNPENTQAVHKGGANR